ncbi:MAG TPA: abscisic acid-deficient protein Aba4 family protein [Thermoanaerobaculia bacterium]|nr:abscisic acid-deficient protein Aba4 family protein [Thermoanaerobaculia bacterium]
MNPFVLPDRLYYVAMALAVAGWLALILFPRRQWANLWFSGLVVPLLLCLLYMYLLLTFWFLPPAANLGEFASLEGVHRMFGNSGLLLVAWLDILAMNLVVGAWMTRKAAQTLIPYVYLLPCLVLTFVFAGFGFALFCLVSGIGKNWPYIARLEAKPPTDSAPVSITVAAAR